MIGSNRIKQELEKIKSELETDNIEIPFDNKVSKISVGFKYHKALPNYEYLEFSAGMDISCNNDNIQELFKTAFESCRNNVKLQLENIIKKEKENE